MAPSYVDTHELKKRVDIIRNNIGETKLPNIYILSGDLSDIEMNSLYNHPKVKAHVSFTKGEGFGRPLLEAMISGKPIIASKWSGHMDFLDNGFNQLVGGELGEIHHSAANDWLIKGSQWFNINHNEGGGYMKAVYENYNKYLELSRKNRKYAKDNFTFDMMTKKLLECLDKWGADSAPQQLQLQLPKLKKIELPKLKKVDVNG
jgi:glycosyltransferase involved in cell wall biosynthesis